MTLDAASLLQAWERGAAQSPAARALLLLGAAQQEAEPEQLAAMSVGERDARLMSLRERWFGGGVECLGSCPRCGEAIEFSFDLEQLRVGHAQPGASFTVDCDGHELRLRLPNSTDLLALHGERDAGLARRRLLARCVLDAETAPEAATMQRLAEAAIERVEQRMAELDPQAEVLLDVQCPNCGHPSQAPFEIENYMWSELDSWARGLLRDVHRLAATYGWREADILAMSPLRRRAYLEMLG
jgi:hypothetical protein